jgi:hypothetical protein
MGKNNSVPIICGEEADILEKSREFLCGVCCMDRRQTEKRREGIFEKVFALKPVEKYGKV